MDKTASVFWFDAIVVRFTELEDKALSFIDSNSIRVLRRNRMLSCYLAWKGRSPVRIS
jgi:hypothetical protein